MLLLLHLLVMKCCSCECFFAIAAAFAELEVLPAYMFCAIAASFAEHVRAVLVVVLAGPIVSASY